jgi:hypothetical protein
LRFRKLWRATLEIVRRARGVSPLEARRKSVVKGERLHFAIARSVFPFLTIFLVD